MGLINNFVYFRFFTFVAELTWPKMPTQWTIFLAQFFLESRLLSESLKLLISLLAYLELKLWLKTKNWIKFYPNKR